MKESRALMVVLESLARTFTEHRVDLSVKPSMKNTFHISGNTIYVDLHLPRFPGLSEEEQLRIIVDALNHECEHINLDFSKEKIEKFIERTGGGKLARWILTIVEDHYTDFSRLQRWRGLKKARTFLAKTLIQKELPIYKIKDEKGAALKGLFMLNYAGFAKGADRASAAVKSFLTKARERLIEVRRMHSYENREKVAEELLNAILMLEGECMLIEDLDSKIDFDRIKVVENKPEHMAKIEDADEVDIDDALIFSWNEMPKSDLSLSSFERQIFESIEELQMEMNRIDDVIRGSIAKRDMRINPAQIPKIPESVVSELTSLLERIKTEDRFIEAEWGEEINIRNVIRFLCGESARRLYYETKPADTGGRAILLAIDLSGSMKDKIEDTIVASHIVATATESLNDRLAAFGFQEKTGITSFVKITPMKFWHERYKPEYFTGFDIFGSTPLKEAVVEAGEWLKSIYAKEKIAFIFTDAEPTSSTPRDVYKVVCALQRTNLNVIGIGVGNRINPEMLSFCFGSSYVWVPNVKDLPHVLFSTYTKFLDPSTLRMN
jgi:hypothetical protein